MEVKGVVNGITVYDDFAHHPTAIETTIDGLRKKVGNQKIIAILEPRSNTMRMGVHKNELAQAWQAADEIHIMQPNNLNWSLEEAVENSTAPVYVHKDVDSIITTTTARAKHGDHILIMSNGGFNGIHGKLLTELNQS